MKLIATLMMLIAQILAPCEHEMKIGTCHVVENETIYPTFVVDYWTCVKCGKKLASDEVEK